MNFQQQEQFYQMVNKSKSRAASTPKEDAIVTEIVDGLIISNQQRKLNIFLNHKRQNRKQRYGILLRMVHSYKARLLLFQVTIR